MSKSMTAHTIIEPPAETPSRKRDFGKLWAGQSVSLFGDEFMVLALPLLSVTLLHTSAATAALLPFALFVPFLILGLPAGAIIDRVSRRITMIVCNTVQLAAFTLIWLLAAVHHLNFAILMGLLLLSGCGVVFFQIAYTSYLPSLIADTDELHRGNARLALSESTAKSVGPMIAGPLIQILGVVTAVSLNAASFAISIFSLSTLRHREPIPGARPRPKGWIRRDIADGLRFVVSHRVLEPTFACSTTYVLFLSMVETLLVLYCLNVLHLAPRLIGVVIGAAAAGYPIGNLLSTRLTKALGTHTALMVAATTSVAGILLMPALGMIGGIVGTSGLVGASVLHSIGEGMYSPIALTVRQVESPSELLSRVGSVQRVFTWGAVALGSLLAAGATAVLGLDAAIWIGAVGTVLALPALFRRGVFDAVLARAKTVNPGANHPPSLSPTWRNQS
jgi:MFS family permease